MPWKIEEKDKRERGEWFSKKDKRERDFDESIRQWHVKKPYASGVEKGCLMPILYGIGGIVLLFMFCLIKFANWIGFFGTRADGSRRGDWIDSVFTWENLTWFAIGGILLYCLYDLLYDWWKSRKNK